MTGNGRLAFGVGLVAGLLVALSSPWATRAAQSATGAGVTTAPPALVAQQVDPAAPLTLAEARTIAAGAIARAESRGQRLAVAVVDEGGHVIVHGRGLAEQRQGRTGQGVRVGNAAPDDPGHV